MKRTNKFKAYLARVLAAAMVLTMAVPPAQAYAANHGENVVITFDPGSGPNLSHSNYSTLPRSGNISTATGKAGHALTTSTDFNGISTETHGSGRKPVLPTFNVTWTGYTFDAWYDEEGRKLEHMPYAFPYKNVTYTARWKGNAANPFNLKIMHYRDRDAARNAITDGANPAAWPSDAATDIRKFYEGITTKTVNANDPVTATYKRNIPGYKIGSVLIKNNKNRRYDDTEGNGTLDASATINESTNSLRGKMPNDNLTVAFRYEPDTSKKFPLRVEYRNASNVELKPAKTTMYSAEQEIAQVSPENITAYILENSGGSLSTGSTDDLLGRGIYSASAAGCHFDTAWNYTGKMPNQPVTIVYKYKEDPNYHTAVNIHILDNHGNALAPVEAKQVSPNTEVVLDVPEKTGYNYPPNITWIGNMTDVVRDETNHKFKFKTDIAGGSVTITYNENLNDSTNWARVNYYNSAHGSLTGDSSPKSFRKGTYPLDEITGKTNGTMDTSADDNYRFNGWYKANASGTDKMGAKLPDSIELNGDTKLFAEFVEDETKWFDIKFESGSHGSISGPGSTGTQHVNKDQTYNDLSVPAAAADSNYQFDGWYNGNDKVDIDALKASNSPITGSATYKARFIPIGGDDTLSIPDGRGSVGSDGLGKVEVSGANDLRKYVLTDKDGKVLQVKTGAELASGKFEGLNPCESYKLYELPLSVADPTTGDDVETAVPASDRSQPGLVTVPALGSNYSTADDATPGFKKIVVNPAAPGTVYALLDIDGNVVAQTGSADGWISPSGSPLTAEFTGLDPNTTYTVVAKPAGDSSAPADRAILGSQILVTGDANQAREYTFRLTGGGFIESVTSGTEVTDYGAGTNSVTVKAGDKVAIDAPTANSAGGPFRNWEVLIGGVSITHLTRRNQPVDMPAGDVIIQANYDPVVLATASNVTVDYTPKNGIFALDKSDDKLSALKNLLAGNAADEALITGRSDIGYTIKFNRHAPADAEADAVKAELDTPETAKIAWSLDIDLTRKVDGTNKPLVPEADGGNHTPEIKVYGKLDNSALGNMEYQLWKLDKTAGGTAEEIEMQPDPNVDGFTGSFSFEANVGDTIVLSYYKAYEVTILDVGRGQTHVVRVAEGDSLDDTEAYMDLDLRRSIYTDAVTGINYEFKGLSKRQTGETLYETSDAVTRDMTLYVIYRPEDDTLWQEAHRKLSKEIDTGNALSLSGNISEADRDELRNAVADAVAVRNRLPRPTITELENAYDTLKAVIDRIRNSSGSGGHSGGSGGHSGGSGGHSGGSGGSGGGGGGRRGAGSSQALAMGKGSSVENNYPNYWDGIDGHWNNFDKPNHGWSFDLTTGSRIKDGWANIKYTHEGVTHSETYHFNSEGVMDSGWFLDQSTGRWYFLATVHDGWFGRMIRGWHYDNNDGKWYYLSPLTGAMLLGWQQIDGSWYFLTPENQQRTWNFNAASNKWEYSHNGARPLGSMYANETTPDGYPVDGNGVWIRETP